MPLQIAAHPVDFPALRPLDVGSFCHRRLNDRRRLEEMRANFYNLHVLARNANIQIHFGTDMDWWPLRFQKIRSSPINFLCFKLTKCHAESPWKRSHKARLTRRFGAAEQWKTGRRAAVGYVSSSPSSDTLSNWLLRRTVRIST